MGLWPVTTTPSPSQEREESQQGVANVDNSSNEENVRKNTIKEYSANLNMVSFHINTLAGSGVLLLSLIVFIVLIRWILRGGLTKMINGILALDCVQLCSCRGQPSPRQPEAPSPGQEPPPYTPQEVGTGDQRQGEQQEGLGASLTSSSISEIRQAQQALMNEMAELKSSIKFSKKLSETTIGMTRGMRTEIRDMRDLCRETISENAARRQRYMVPPNPTPVGRVYPRVPAPTDSPEYLTQFFNQLLAGDQEVPLGNGYGSDTSELADSVNLSIQ